MEVLLNQSDLIFLLRHTKDENLLSVFRQAKECEQPDTLKVMGTARYIIVLDVAQRESILDILSNLLSEQGIDKLTYEPNSLGYRIEKLIDIFSPYFA